VTYLLWHKTGPGKYETDCPYFRLVRVGRAWHLTDGFSERWFGTFRAAKAWAQEITDAANTK
jgi:hypothetical protein